MSDGPKGIKDAVDQAEKPKKTRSAKPAGKDKPGNVVDFRDENTLRLQYEERIQATEDFDELVYRLAVEIQGAKLHKATQTGLLKQIARKSGTNLESLRELAPSGGGEGPERGRGRADFLPYEIESNQLWVFDEKGRRPLCNFVARITEEVIYDNGLEEDCLFRIEGRLGNGLPLPPVEVSSSKYPGMAWVTGAWGARALIHAGTSIKDHLRAAIQGLSHGFQRRTVYGYTGWRKIGEQWAFLHGGGAIGPAGNRADIEVRAGEGHMKRYAFETTDGGGDPRADIRASLRLLDIAPENRALGVVLLASAYRAPTAEAAAIDHGIFLSGQTGARKSEAAAMALAHFGRGFDRKQLPANWDDTEADMEAKCHAAKDVLIVVDDFKPRGAAVEVHKLHVKADRLFRAVGNQSGRGRRTTDMKQRAAYHPRGLVVATGEDIPRGQSLRARLAVVELGLTDIDNAVLSELQQLARAGALERAMTGFLRWLGKDMDEWKASLPGCLRAFRDTAIGEGFARSHARAADIYASLLIGLDLFRQYATEAGALNREEAASIFDQCEATLKQLVSAQGDLQADQDEVRQFFSFLHSSLNAGLCHFSDALTQGPPSEHPSFWGWRVIPGVNGEPDSAKPQGERIGWVDDVRVYLDGHAAFAAVQEMAKSVGENLAITELTLWKRMNERGLLMDVVKEKESGKLRLQARPTVGGVRRRAYILHRETLELR